MPCLPQCLMQTFMEHTLDKATSTESALLLVRKYQGLTIAAMDPQHKFGRILQQFGKDIDVSSPRNSHETVKNSIFAFFFEAFLYSSKCDFVKTYSLKYVSFIIFPQNVQKLYQKQKNDPPCGRVLPPIAGKIAWARQLFRKIEQPMLV